MGAYMIFRKRFNEANKIGKLVREITERYDNQYIDMTIKSVGRVYPKSVIRNLYFANF